MECPALGVRCRGCSFRAPLDTAFGHKFLRIREDIALLLLPLLDKSGNAEFGNRLGDPDLCWLVWVPGRTFSSPFSGDCLSRCVFGVIAGFIRIFVLWILKFFGGDGRVFLALKIKAYNIRWYDRDPQL